MIKKREIVRIPLERFTVDGKPVCAASFNVSSEESFMVCEFLEQVNDYGKYRCGFHNEDIPRDDMIYPLSDCPLWKKK